AAGEELEIRTWVEDFRRVRSRRRYEVRGADGALRLVARTDWVYVDLASGRPRRVPAEMEDAFGGTSVPQERDGWHAPPPPARPARATHQVRVYELDSLGHMNNAVHLDLVAQAALDAIEHAGWPLARLVADGTVPVLAGGDLEYREPARYGDRLETTTWFAPLADGLDVHQHVARAGDGRPVVGEAPGERSPGACPLLLHECDVAAVLGFLPFELGEHRPRALALGGEQADEDLVAQWRRPSRTAGEPGGERPLAARREAKQAPQARAERLIASNHEAATLELVQQLIDLPDVRVPERAEAL